MLSSPTPRVDPREPLWAKSVHRGDPRSRPRCSSDRGDAVAAVAEVAVLAQSEGDATRDLAAEVGEVDDGVDHELRREAVQVDVLLVDGALLVDVGRALVGVL